VCAGVIGARLSMNLPSSLWTEIFHCNLGPKSAGHHFGRGPPFHCRENEGLWKLRSTEELKITWNWGLHPLTVLWKRSLETQERKLQPLADSPKCQSSGTWILSHLPFLPGRGQLVWCISNILKPSKVPWSSRFKTSLKRNCLLGWSRGYLPHAPKAKRSV